MKTPAKQINRGSTLFLRSVIILMGLVVLAICTLALPPVILSELRSDFDYGPILLGLYVAALPFFVALYRALQLLSYIDTNQAFSEMSARAFGSIRNCALAISGLFAAGMPYVFYVGDRDDAPGVVALGIVIIGASLVIATFAALLQKLVQNAVDIKTENDLTV